MSAVSSAISAARSVVLPARGAHKATVVFLHGLGDSPSGGWQDVAEEIQKSLPGLKFILPSAPIQPVTLNFGMKMPSWHDIVSLRDITESDFKGIDTSKKIVEDILHEEIEKNGTKSENIILAGFSQGAAMSLLTGLQFSHKLAAITALSGYLPYSGDFSKVLHEKNAETPVLLCHGDADEVVLPKFGQLAHDTLKKAGVKNLTQKIYSNMGHSSSLTEIRDITTFWKSILEKNEAAASK